jgi:5-hydroxyisourate hydrolase
MPSLSTHVLDTAAGGPQPGITVTVTDDHGAVVGSGTTDDSGRIADLVADLPTGTYRIRWATGGRFVDEVAVSVRLTEDRHYHVPLLASPVSAVVYLGQ